MIRIRTIAYLLLWLAACAFGIALLALAPIWYLAERRRKSLGAIMTPEPLKQSTTMIRQTHTYVKLPLSPAAYDEIAQRLKDANYEPPDSDGVIDMHGVAIVKEEEKPGTIINLANLAQAAYEAYCEHRGWKSFDGDDLPQWALVAPGIQAGWCAAARGVIHAFDRVDEQKLKEPR
jgi:hypothetical protein